MIIPKRFLALAIFDLIVALVQDYQYEAPFDMRAIANAKSLHHALTLCGWSCEMTPEGDLAIEVFPNGPGRAGDTYNYVDYKILHYLSPYTFADKEAGEFATTLK